VEERPEKAFPTEDGSRKRNLDLTSDNISAEETARSSRYYVKLGAIFEDF
jgi:hypothetical protein